MNRLVQLACALLLLVSTGCTHTESLDRDPNVQRELIGAHMVVRESQPGWGWATSISGQDRTVELSQGAKLRIERVWERRTIENCARYADARVLSGPLRDSLVRVGEDEDMRTALRLMQLVARSLGDSPSAAERSAVHSAVTALVNHVEASNSPVHDDAVDTLGKFGALARDALPALRESSHLWTTSGALKLAIYRIEHGDGRATLPGNTHNFR